MTFDHVLISGLPVKIICLLSGLGILVIDKDTDDELKFELLCEADREQIQSLAFEWRDYHLDMRKFNETNIGDNKNG